MIYPAVANCACTVVARHYRLAPDFIMSGPGKDDEKQEQQALAGRAVDLVLSDMAPNMSGMAATDQARSMYLVELALEFAMEHLKPNGAFVVKIFQGEGFDDFVRAARKGFDKVLVRKPDASRPRSREVYLVATGLATGKRVK